MLPPDVLLAVSLSLGMLTATPQSPAGTTFLEGWPGFDGETLTLESSYAKGIMQEGKAEGLVVLLVPSQAVRPEAHSS
jgi:hypothetical protein